MVYSYDQVATTKDKVSGLVQGVSDSQSFTFDRGIARLSLVCESAADEGDAPASGAAERNDLLACAVFLE